MPSRLELESRRNHLSERDSYFNGLEARARPQRRPSCREHKDIAHRRDEYRCMVRTFADMVLTRRAERVVGSPAGDGRAIRVARAVLVLLRRPKLHLRVELQR